MHELIQTALAEDAAFRDLTAQATIPAERQGTASIRAKAAGILSGTAVAAEVFRQVDAAIAVRWQRHDGDVVAAGDRICELAGPLRTLLAAERTALNFLQHLSGIATATHAYVRAIAGTACAIYDTRKTTPGLRGLEKQAVVHGGGLNHRMDLASGLLIKENHIAACGSLSRAVRACRGVAGRLWVEVECETLDQVREAVAARPDMILLDNMTPDMVQGARALVPGTIVLEASGGITLANARAYAEAGADRLAIGAITHSAPVLDLSMRVS
jgi:nicotinate-nucleotide pyrophosphorylase (carboxylating)